MRLRLVLLLLLLLLLYRRRCSPTTPRLQRLSPDLQRNPAVGAEICDGN